METFVTLPPKAAPFTPASAARMQPSISSVVGVVHCLVAAVLMLACTTSIGAVIVMDFEEGRGLPCLGNGPCGVHFLSNALTESLSGRPGGGISFENASYSPQSSPISSSGQVAIVSAAFPYQPIRVSFDFPANAVSVHAFVSRGDYPTTMVAFDTQGVELDSDSTIGDGGGLDSSYTATLSVGASGGIRTVVLTGYLQFGFNGWETVYDDLTVTAIPEPSQAALLAFGIVCLLARRAIARTLHSSQCRDVAQCRP